MARAGLNKPILEMDRPSISTNNGNRSKGISQEEIARRAYEFFLARGSVHGSDQEDWFQAEQELQHRTVQR